MTAWLPSRKLTIRTGLNNHILYRLAYGRPLHPADPLRNLDSPAQPAPAFSNVRIAAGITHKRL